MSDMEFSFKAAPWEPYVDSLRPGDRASASTLLSLMEGETDEVFEEVMDQLDMDSIYVDIRDLPQGYGNGSFATRLRQEQQLAAKGLPLGELEETDPLRLYLDEIAAIPACGDEEILIEEYYRGDENAADKIVNLGLSRVVSIAKEYAGRGVLLLDLIQEGSIGLWKAIQNWQKGIFRVESDWWIRYAMSRAILLQARADGVGSKLRSAMEDYRSVDERLLAELGRNPTTEEIAEALHVTSEAAAEISRMVENARRLQLAKHEPDEEEEEREEQQAVEDTSRFQTRQLINDMLSDLTDTEAKLITLRFGLEGGLPLSPGETGRKLGMTPDEVVAMEAAAMTKMRKS